MSKWKIADFDEVDEWYSIIQSPGCYAIYLDGVLSYIGSALRVRKRVLQHKIRLKYSNFIYTPWGRALKVFVKFSGSEILGDWKMREYRLIQRLRPRFNRLSI